MPPRLPHAWFWLGSRDLRALQTTGWLEPGPLDPCFPESCALHSSPFFAEVLQTVSPAWAPSPQAPSEQGFPGAALGVTSEAPCTDFAAKPGAGRVRAWRGGQEPSLRELGEPGWGRDGGAALTLLKFGQAARAAEGAHGGRLPAAASLHPRGLGGLRVAGRYMVPGPGMDGSPGRTDGRARTSEGRLAEAAAVAGTLGAGREPRYQQCTTAAPCTSQLTPSAPREPS